MNRQYYCIVLGCFVVYVYAFTLHMHYHFLTVLLCHLIQVVKFFC